VHVSRRSNIVEARKRLMRLVKREHADRVEFLMDHRRNKALYERQAEEAARIEAQRSAGASA